MALKTLVVQGKIERQKPKDRIASLLDDIKMVVLACDRRDCKYVMCDRLILNGTRYICPECWDQLVKVKETWPERCNVEAKIREFMDSPKDSGIKEDRDTAFERLT